jgi:hypothetical protein
MRLLPFLILISFTASAQIREIPRAVKDSFSKRYPSADSVVYTDYIISVDVGFQSEGDRMVASFTNKGEWKQTARELGFHRLPEEVAEGFSKSRYSESEWKVMEAAQIYLPDGSGQYRIRIEKNELLKKYLFFNNRGRMLREAITL